MNESQSTELELTPARKRQFVLVALILAGAVLFVFAELLVRGFFRYNTPDTLRENSLQYVPSTFTRHLLAPDQAIDLDAAWGLKDGVEGSGRTYAIGERGYRGRTFEVPKPPGTCRVVILGGSAVFDLGATEGEDWPRQVENLLQEAGHTGVEVINAGVPGHSSADAVGKLYAQLWVYEPDVVLLYNAWNDLKTFTKLSHEQPLISLVSPHDPQADPFQNYGGPIDRVLAHSQVYVKLRTRYLLWKYDVGAEGQVRVGEELATDFDPLALEQYRLNVELVVDTAQNRGALPLLLTQATLVAADNSKEDRARISYGYQGMEHDTLVTALGACNDAVRSVGEAKGVEVLDLAERFTGRSELFDDHVHTSREGSAELARSVAEFLGSRLSGCGGGTATSSD